MMQNTMFSDETAVLRRMLELMMTPSQRQAEKEILTSERLHVAASAYFLLDTYPQHDIETCISYTLNRLLRQLNRCTEQHQVEYQGQVRGRINWTATSKARHSKGNDPTRYVCREVRHQYDTPQNQLLKYLVEHFSRCLERIPPVLRRGGCYAYQTEGKQIVSCALRLGGMEVMLNNFRRHAHLRDVTLPVSIEESHLIRCESARIEEYAELAGMYRRYVQCVEKPDWTYVFTTGKRALLLPGNTRKDGERWIQLAVFLLKQNE